jgi:hypothetical protein
VQVAEQPEAGDVDHRVRAGGQGGAGGLGVERRHDVDGGRARSSSPTAPRLRAVVMAPMPSGLVSTSASPARPPGVRDERARVDRARDREPVLRLGIVDRVPAREHSARRGQDVGAAAQDLAQHGAEALERKATTLSALSGRRPSRRRRRARW